MDKNRHLHQSLHHLNNDVSCPLPALKLPSSSSSLGECTCHAAPVTCLHLSPKTGRLLASGSEDKKINLTYLGKPSATCIASLVGHTTAIESVKFGGNEDVICGGSVSGGLKVWDLESTEVLRTFSGHKCSITCLDFHPYGDFFASGSLDSNIKLWDSRKKSCMYAYRAHGKDVRCLRFSPDGRWLASGGDEGVIKIWDLAAGNILAEFNDHSSPVTDLAFHPNELLLTSSSLDGTVRFWDLEAFVQVSSSTNESGPIYKVAYNEEGTVLFSCARDLLTCYQWEPTRTLSSLIVNWGRVRDLFVTPHSIMAASATVNSASIFAVNLGNKSPLTKLAPVVTSHHSNLNLSKNDDVIPTHVSSMKDFSPHFKSNLSFSVSSGLNNAPSSPNLSSVPSTAMINAVASSMASSQLCQNVLPKSTPLHLPPINGVSARKPSSSPASTSFTITPFSSKQKLFDDKADNMPECEENLQLDLFPSVAKDLHLNNKPTLNVAPSSISTTTAPSNKPTGVKTWNQHQNNNPLKTLSNVSSTTNNKVTNTVLPSTTATISRVLTKTTKAAAIIYPEPKKKPSPPASVSSDERVDMIPETRDHPAGLDIDDFLPKHLQDTVRLGYPHPQPEISESEAMTSIMKGHKSLVTALSHRKKNVQIVLALWCQKDAVKGIEQAVHFEDQSIIVDILNVINLKP